MGLIIMNKFAVVDLETTGNAPHKNDRIIEIGIVIYENNQITSQYSQLINPNQHISRFITHLTGISNQMVMDQPSFDQVARDIRAMFEDAYFVAHNVPFDLGFLNVELKNAGLMPINQPIIDTVELSRILLPQAPSFKLSQLSDWLKLQHVDPHRAFSDAYVTAKLLDQLLNKLNVLPLTTIKRLTQLEPYLKSSLGKILHKLKEQQKKNQAVNEAFEYAYGLAFKPIEDQLVSKSQQELTFGEYLDHLFSDHSPFHHVFPHFEFRTGQREMAEYVFHAFTSGKHALIEADTGTGKTLAYLVAALYYAIHNQEQVLISTYLTQLQKQLINQEIPRLQEVLPFSFTTTVLKGKHHYLSLRLFSQALQEQNIDHYDHALTKAILTVWLTETTTGDIDDVQLPQTGYQFFRQVSVAMEESLPSGHDKSFCYYTKAQLRAQRADLIIINHALLGASFTHESILPKLKKIIVDEAHQLSRATAHHFGIKLDYVTYQRHMDRIEALIKRIGTSEKSDLFKLITHLREEGDTLFRFLYLLAHGTEHRATNDIGRVQYQVEDDHHDWQLAIDLADRIKFLLLEFITEFKKLQDQESRHSVIISQSIEEINELKQIISQYFSSSDHQVKVQWIEADPHGAPNAVYLFQEPLNIDTLLREQCFDHYESVVLTSATLTVAQDFDYFKEQVGLLGADLLERRIPSPYDYPNQVKVLIPNDFPTAHYQSMDPFIEATCEAIFSLAELTKGRMLILFNAYDMLKKAYALLKNWFNDDYLLIAQGISSGSHERLKKNFQNFDQAILLGTNAFWEGLDIPGKDLACVVIVRLPFDSPNHPVYHLQGEQLKQQGKNPFVRLSLPRAVIRFKQGFGRLIRSQNDQGIIFICDDRIMTKPYGRKFIESIPEVPIYHRRTHELLDIAKYSL